MPAGFKDLPCVSQAGLEAEAEPETKAEAEPAIAEQQK